MAGPEDSIPILIQNGKYDAPVRQRAERLGVGREWGPGDNAQNTEPWGTARVGKETVQLIHGKHPHSRQDNSIYARFPDGSIEPFDGHRVIVDVELSSSNYLKTSGLSGNEVRKAGQCIISFDNRAVYSFAYREPLEALHRAASTLSQLLGLSARLWMPDVDLANRRVWYIGEPAIIRGYNGMTGEIALEAETPSGVFQTPPWHRGDEPPIDADKRDVIRTDVLDGNIYWFRDAPPDAQPEGPSAAVVQ